MLGELPNGNTSCTTELRSPVPRASASGNAPASQSEYFTLTSSLNTRTALESLRPRVLKVAHKALSPHAMLR